MAYLKLLLWHIGNVVLRVGWISKLIRVGQWRSIKNITGFIANHLWLLSFFVFIILCFPIQLTLTIHKAAVLFNIRSLFYDWTWLFKLRVTRLWFLALVVSIRIVFFKLMLIVDDRRGFYHHMLCRMRLLFKVMLILIYIFDDFLILTLHILNLFF